MTKIKEAEELVVCMFLSVFYLVDLHLEKRLFHGDIKPENIFFNKRDRRVTSDCGSLIVLYGEDETYQVRTFTRGYASRKYVTCCQTGTPMTYQELMEEDYLQLQKTFKQMVRVRREFARNPAVKLMDESFSKCTSIETLKELILQDFNLLREIVQAFRSESFAPKFSIDLWDFIPEMVHPGIHSKMGYKYDKEASSTKFYKYDINLLALQDFWPLKLVSSTKEKILQLFKIEGKPDISSWLSILEAVCRMKT